MNHTHEPERRCTNQEVARLLRSQAALLAQKVDNLYRIRAYRRAAMAVMALTEEVSSILNSRGKQGLEAIPGIGKSLAETIAGFVSAECGVRNDKLENHSSSEGDPQSAPCTPSLSFRT